MLKKDGRVGHSAHFGAAIWAEQRENISIAISLSGCGEAIIRTQLAEKLAQQSFSWFQAFFFTFLFTIIFLGILRIRLHFNKSKYFWKKIFLIQDD